MEVVIDDLFAALRGLPVPAREMVWAPATKCQGTVSVAVDDEGSMTWFDPINLVANNSREYVLP